MRKFSDRVKKYVLYNIVGTLGFGISTGVYFLCLHFDIGGMSWFIGSFAGGLFSFLIFYTKVDIYRKRTEEPCKVSA